MKALKEDYNKVMQEGVLLKGLTKLLESNTQNIISQTKQMNEKWATMMNPPKTEESSTTTVE